MEDSDAEKAIESWQIEEKTREVDDELQILMECIVIRGNGEDPYVKQKSGTSTRGLVWDSTKSVEEGS